MIAKISVVIPTNNRPSELQRAIKSLKNQTVYPAQIIVIDDGSRVKLTRDIFKNVSEKIECLLFYNSKPKGPGFSRNLGIKKSTSEWVAFLDDDDEFYPEKIEYISSEIDSETEADLIYHPATVKMDNESLEYKTTTSKRKEGKIYNQLLAKNIIGGTPMVTVKKESIISAGLFDEKLKSLEDYEMWIRLSKTGTRFRLINKPLTKCHSVTQKESVSKSLKNHNASIKAIEQKYIDDLMSLSKKEKIEHEKWKANMLVHKALLNRQNKLAILEQYSIVRKFPSGKSLLLLIIVLFGSDLTFRIKSWMS